MAPSSNAIERLPLELLVWIFNKLQDMYSLIAIRRVCKLWREAFRDISRFEEPGYLPYGFHPYRRRMLCCFLESFRSLEELLLHRFHPAVWEALVRNSNHLFTPRLLCVQEVELDLSFLSLASPHLEELSISSTVQFKSLPRLARLKRCILDFRGKSESAKRELEEFLEFCEGIFTVNAPKLKGVALTNTRGRLLLQGNNLERLLLGFSYIDKAFRSNKHTKLNLEKLQVLEVRLLSSKFDELYELDEEEEDAVEEVTKVLLAAAPNVDFRLTIPENDTYDDSPPSPLLFTRIVQLFVQRNKRRFPWPRMLNYFPGYEDLPTRVPDLFEEDETKGLPEQKDLLQLAQPLLDVQPGSCSEKFRKGSMELSGNAFDPARTEVGYRPIVGHFLAAFTSLPQSASKSATTIQLHRKLLHPRPSLAFQLDQPAPAGRDLSEFFPLDEQAKSFTNEAVLLRMYGRDRAINQHITLGVLGGRGTDEWPEMPSRCSTTAVPPRCATYEQGGWTRSRALPLDSNGGLRERSIQWVSSGSPPRIRSRDQAPQRSSPTSNRSVSGWSCEAKVAEPASLGESISKRAMERSSLLSRREFAQEQPRPPCISTRNLSKRWSIATSPVHAMQSPRGRGHISAPILHDAAVSTG
ncbi:hypothetical protein SELMODRAFT_403694 [Selaginella moellendorffii]|uniref:F-box domain-containing protein n=1 Tax=Selaginella moellendorffii TaxID=88036 RepID=D8QS82_SELML|nr:hypothetical protein SELMODRAFT_403694 [Selaginella moellendorffii]